jgi:hypothetical protein
LKKVQTVLYNIERLTRRRETMQILVKIRKVVERLANHAMASVLAVIVLYLSLVTTSQPVTDYEQPEIDRAIAVLAERGFDTEAFLLENTTTFRRSDHWLNEIVFTERAYAATNFPFQIVTVYSDFYAKAADETERAMILLHESRHLLGEGEPEAYAYVWKNRERLGWTLKSHGTTPVFITIEQQTREFAPELFTCPDRLWNDCTEQPKP